MSASASPTANLESQHKMAQQQPHLFVLPPELLAEICRYLCWHCQLEHVAAQRLYENRVVGEKADLLSLARVCKALRPTALPFLYHHMQTSRPFDLYYFVCELARWPRLAANVREVNVNRLSGVPATTLNTAKSPNDLDAVYIRLRDAGVDLTRGTLQSSGWRSEEVDRAQVATGHAVLVSMVLELARNIQSCHLYLFSEGVFQFPPQFNPSGSFLTSLTTLRIATVAIKIHLLDEIAPILRLAPNIKVLQLDECRQVFRRSDLYPPTTLWTPTTRPQLQNLSELRLIDTDLTEASLRDLLSALGPSLSKLSIQRLSK